jgi:hypothetical protein
MQRFPLFGTLFINQYWAECARLGAEECPDTMYLTSSRPSILVYGRRAVWGRMSLTLADIGYSNEPFHADPLVISLISMEEGERNKGRRDQLGQSLY